MQVVIVRAVLKSLQIYVAPRKDQYKPINTQLFVLFHMEDEKTIILFYSDCIMFLNCKESGIELGKLTLLRRLFMNRSVLRYACVLFFLVVLMSVCLEAQDVSAQNKGARTEEVIKLPPPKLDSTMSVEKALSERRTVRSYKEDSLTLAEISQLLWAAQGITEPQRGLRTAPSANARYLLETYVVSGNVAGLSMGLYKYHSKGHELVKVAEGDKKAELFKAVGQVPIKNAPAVIVFSGMPERSKKLAFMYLEAGHAAQNMQLQAQSRLSLAR